LPFVHEKRHNVDENIAWSQFTPLWVNFAQEKMILQGARKDSAGHNCTPLV